MTSTFIRFAREWNGRISYVALFIFLILSLEQCKRLQIGKLPELKYCEADNLSEFHGGCIGDCGAGVEDKKLPKLMQRSSQSFEFYENGNMYHNICCHGEGNFKGTWWAENGAIKFTANYYAHPTDCLYGCAEDFSEKSKEKLNQCNAQCYADFKEIFGKPVVQHKITGSLSFPNNSDGRLTMAITEENPQKVHVPFNYPTPYSNVHVGCVKAGHGTEADDWTDQPNPMY